MPSKSVNSSPQKTTVGGAVSTGRLGGRQIVSLTGLGVLLCFSGALLIRYGIAAGLFGGRVGILLFALSVPLAPTLVWMGERVAALGGHQLVPGIALMTAVAVFCGGIALTWFPAAYGLDPGRLYLGAAWLLFDVGVNLLAALFISMRRNP